jgi:CHRD domain
MSDIKTTRPKVLAAVSALAFAILFSLVAAQQSVYAQQQSSPTFTAELTGKNEVPPVNTQATGVAQFQLSADGKEINYDLSARDLNGFMMAHIHQGKAEENGQPITSPLSIGKGKITSTDLQGPLAGKQISDLVNIIKNGQAYVNVHTDQNQNGEIRGQITSGNPG